MLKSSGIQRSELFSKPNLSTWILFILVIAAVVMELTAIVLNLNTSLRLDESQQLWASTKTIPGILSYIARDVHVPLYAVLSHLVIQIFGNNVIYVRLLSTIFFILSIPAVYKMAQTTATKKIAFITTLLYFLSPFLTWYGTEARMYSLFTLITIVTHYLFIKLLNSNFSQYIIWYIATGVIGIYTHYFFGLVILFQLIYLFFYQLSQYEDELQTDQFAKERVGWKLDWAAFKSTWPAMIKFSKMLAVVALSFLPWALYVMSQGSSANTKPLLTPPTTYNFLQIFVHFFSGFQTTSTEAILISIWPLVVIFLFFSFSKRKKQRITHTSYYLLLTFGPIILTMIISYLYRPLLVSRYLIFITPSLFYLLALLIDQFSKPLFTATIGLILVGTVIFQYQQSVYKNIAEKEDYRAVSEYLSTHISNESVITVSAPFTIYPIEYYYQGHAKIETIPYWNRYTPTGIPPYSEAELQQQLETYSQIYESIVLVLSYDQGYEEEIKTYMRNNFELVEQKDFSPGLELYEYRLPLSYLDEGW